MDNSNRDKGDQLDSFVREMIDARHLTGVTDEVYAHLVNDLKQRLLDQIDRALIDALPEEKLDEFSALLDNLSLDDEVVQRFIIDAGVNVTGIAAETMSQFRDSYIAPEGRKAQ